MIRRLGMHCTMEFYDRFSDTVQPDPVALRILFCTGFHVLTFLANWLKLVCGAVSIFVLPLV